MAEPTRRRLGAGSLYLWFVAGLFILIGGLLAIGGAYLATLGGSLYYLLAGLGLMVSGWFILRRNVLGVWVYLAVYIATLIWAFWEVGTQPWPLLPRVFAPTILLLLVLLTLPLLARDKWTWPRAIGAALVALVLFVAGAAILALTEERTSNPLPAPLGAAMVDPSPLQTGADWPAYGGTYAAQRFTPLTQITPDNVGNLKRAWVYHTRDLPEDMADNKYGAETTPLKVGNALYLCTAMNILVALDPATGREIWRFDPKVSEDWIPYTAACRGVTYFEDAAAAANALCRTRIVEGTLDGRLIAVDARTGRPCPQFGANGQVDMKAGMGPIEPGMVSMTSPPTLVRGVLVTGHQVLDGQKNSAPSGVIQGFDAVTGERRWAWDMMNPAWSPNPPPGSMFTRGTPNSWTIASGDEQLGLVYMPMGNSAVDYWSTDRAPPENEYATALVAIDVTTGRPRWHFRTVDKDVWDYDLGGQATLVDLPFGGGNVPALVLPSKQGDMYILDRRTGRPIFPVERRRVPQGGVEPEQRSPTQPFSSFHTLAFPVLTEADMWGMSPLDQLYCRIGFRKSKYDGMYTPPVADRRSIQYPGYNGGTDWGGVSVDPVRGILIANYNDMPNHVQLIPRERANELGWAPRGESIGEQKTEPRGEGGPQWGTPYAIDVNAGWRVKFTGLLCKEPPYGGIRAIDLRTGRTLWDRPIGTARLNGPFGIPSMLPLTIGTPNNGGPLVTASGLVFLAATTDNLIRALDIRTGKVLWQDVLPAGGQASPMSYSANGKQYVVIMAGGHHFMETPIGDELIAYEVGS